MKKKARALHRARQAPINTRSNGPRKGNAVRDAPRHLRFKPRHPHTGGRKRRLGDRSAEREFRLEAARITRECTSPLQPPFLTRLFRLSNIIMHVLASFHCGLRHRVLSICIRSRRRISTLPLGFSHTTGYPAYHGHSSGGEPSVTLRSLELRWLGVVWNYCCLWFLARPLAAAIWLPIHVGLV